MSFAFDPGLWPPQLRSIEAAIEAMDRGSRVCLYSPTGSGKTRMAGELLRWCVDQGLGGVFYVNRKLLIQQTVDRFTELGLSVGIRAAEFEEQFDASMPVQVASADTEASRVYKKGSWKLHEVGPGGLIVVDEAHIQKSKVMKNLLYYYKNNGARILLLTATPVEMGDWADELVIGGKLSEWRACGALVPVYPFSISQPDMRKVKRNATGEYVLDDRLRRTYMQHIVGEVIENWERLNDGSPTMAYAPGVPESRWLVEQFAARGHKFVHVDATNCVMDGVEAKLTPELWEEILDRVRSGEFRGLSSRFKLREGVDLPIAGHCLLATPVGSVASYLQIAGRVMRTAPGKTQAILQDHGGCLDDQTEVLTRRGWVGIGGVSISDEVAAFDIQTCQVSWQPVLSTHVRRLEKGEMMHVISNSRVDVRVTGNHRAVYKQRTTNASNDAVWPNVFKMARFDEIVSNARMKIPVSGVQDFSGVDLSDFELQLIGWWLTDGTLCSNGKRQCFKIFQAAHYEENIQNIRECLHGCGLDWTETKSRYSVANGEIRDAVLFAVPKGTCKSRPRNGWWKYRKWLNKDVCDELDAMTNRQFEVFLHAIHRGDGQKSQRGDGSYRIFCGNEKMADRIQSMAVRRGWKCNISRASGRFDLNLQSVSETVIHGRGCGNNQARIVVEIPRENEVVWCVANPLETLITRRNGKVAIIGNCYWTHGSPNHDRPWDVLWKMKEGVASSEHTDSIRNGDTPEPIRCYKCGMERMSGPKCPNCGAVAPKSVREIRMENGKIERIEGDLIKPPRRVMKPDTERLWAKMFWGFRKKGVDKSFAQMEGYFMRTHGYLPPRNLPLMPKNRMDWKLKPKEIAMTDLHRVGDVAKPIERKRTSHGESV